MMTKNLIKFIWIALPAAFYCACSSTEESVASADVKQNSQEAAQPIQLKAEYSQKVEQDNTFAFDLLRTFVKHNSESNVFVSPLSISMALSMTLNGAEGETATEMLDALRISGFSMEQVNDYNKTLREALLAVDPSTRINIANSIWNKLGFPVLDQFLHVNKANYAAEIQVRDFTDPTTLKEINQWCEDNTNGKIKEVLDKISPDVVMYLINAIYFKGIWALKFDEAQTRKETFTTEAGAKTQVNMMQLQTPLPYASDHTAGYLELPYGNQAFSMVVALPNEGKTTSDVINHLSSASWNRLGFINCDVKLKLPRFKVECKYEMQKLVLPELGMKKAFTPLAEFKGINPDVAVFISRVIHKTFVEISEEGTEAAAVTVVDMGYTSSLDIPGNIPTINFHADKPFVFFIRERSTGVILFAGKMGDIKE